MSVTPLTAASDADTETQGVFMAQEQVAAPAEDVIIPAELLTTEAAAVAAPEFTLSVPNNANAVSLSFSEADGADYYVVSFTGNSKRNEYKLLDAGSYTFYDFFYNQTCDFTLTGYDAEGNALCSGTQSVTVSGSEELAEGFETNVHYLGYTNGAEQFEINPSASNVDTYAAYCKDGESLYTYKNLGKTYSQRTRLFSVSEGLEAGEKYTFEIGVIGSNYSINTYNTVVVDSVCTPDLFTLTVPCYNDNNIRPMNALNLDVNAVEGADYYVIFLNDGTNTTEYKLTEAGAYSFYGLTQNVTYNVTMTAYDADGNGLDSLSRTVYVGQPSSKRPARFDMSIEYLGLTDGEHQFQIKDATSEKIMHTTVEYCKEGETISTFVSLGGEWQDDKTMTFSISADDIEFGANYTFSVYGLSTNYTVSTPVTATVEGIGLPVLAVPNCSSTITDSQFLCITIEEVENAVGYMILLENGTREVVVNSAGTYYFPSPGESSHDFQVKALGDGVNYTNSSWTDLVRKSSDFAAATNDVTPTAPTLGVKENEGTLQVTVPEIEGAGRYVVEVSTDESFSNVVRAESTESGDIMIEGLDIRTTYYVRTCAMNMDASGEPTNYTNWSELVNVEVGPIGTLAAPGLTAEADGYSFTGAFTAVENAVEYVLSYSTDSTFQENVESITLTPEEIANGFSIDGAAYQFQIQLTPIDTTLENSPLSKVAKLFRVK